MNNGKQPIVPSMWTKVGEGEDDYQPLKDGQKTGWEIKFAGLTKREYFAIMVLQGFSTRAHLHVSIASKMAVEQADALLEELSK